MSLLLLALLLCAPAQKGPRYVISGEVRGSDGKPAAAVTIMTEAIDFNPSQARPQSHRTLSDAKGKFAVRVDGPAKYRLIYRDEEHSYMPQFIPFFRDPSNPPPEVELTEAAPTAQVTVMMSKNGSLSGQAIDTQTQLPIDNLTFVLCRTDEQIPCWRTSKKSGDGKFSIPAPFAPFTLMVASPQYENWGGLTGSDPTRPISVAPGSMTQLNLVMRRKLSAANRQVNEEEKRPGLNLPAPQMISPDDNQVFDLYPRITRLEWNPVEGAASYAVEIDFCQGRIKKQCTDPQPWLSPANPPMTNIIGTTYEFGFVGAQPGRWRVWAVDTDGREGFKSPWRTFFYLK